MTCPYCKTKVANGLQFCPKCGQVITIHNKEGAASSEYWNSINQEAERERKHRADEENKKIEQKKGRRKAAVSSLVAIGIAVLITLAIIAGIFFVLFSSLNQKYNKAGELFEIGEYEEAMVIYEELGTYKDSSELVNECQSYVIEEKYLNAVMDYQRGNYKEALVIFEELGNYKDSQTYIQDCNFQIEQESALSVANNDSPFAQPYWVIFTEGTRDDRIEAACINSPHSPNELSVIWHSYVELNNTSDVSECTQYYLDVSDNWVEMGTWYRFSDNATDILASNLDVYDSGGNLVLQGCPYKDINWSSMHEYTKNAAPNTDPSTAPPSTSLPFETEVQEETEPFYEEPVVQTERIGYVLESSGGLNVRNGPGRDYEQIGRLAPKEQVTILETMQVGLSEWGRIYNGWICLDYITFEKPSSTNATSNDSPLRKGYVLESAGEVNIRNGPGTEYAQIGRLVANEEVIIYEMRDSGLSTWGRISTNGWVCLDYITLFSFT